MSDSKNKKAIKQHDFTKGDILKPIILFSLPVLFGDIFSALYQGDDDTVNFIKAEFSDIHKAFLKIIGR